MCFASENSTYNYKYSASTYNVIIEDDADLLSIEEEKELQNDMKDLTEYGNILFKSIDKNTFISTAGYAEDYYIKTCGRTNGTLFLIDMDKRNIYIYSYGDSYKVITTAKAETITDNIYKLASNKEYYACAQKAYSQINSVFKGEKIAEPMKYISNALIAMMIALFMNFSIFTIATKTRRTGEKKLIQETERFFEHTMPEVEKSGSHREYSPQSDGGRRRSAVAGGGRWWPVAGGRRSVEAGGGHSF